MKVKELENILPKYHDGSGYDCQIIYTMADQGEDYSLILRNYNELIEEYGLPISKIGWVNNMT